MAAAEAPHYRQNTVTGLVKFIDRKITSGEWTELPTIKEIRRMSGLTSPPVIRALRQLADNGLVAKYVGPGIPRGHRWVIAAKHRPKRQSP